MSSSIEGVQVAEVSLEQIYTFIYAQIMISEGPRTNDKDFGDSCRCIINELKGNRETERVFLEKLVVYVDLPRSEEIWAVDRLLYAFFNSMVYWDTLEIIMPLHDLADSDTSRHSKVHGSEDETRALALAHLAATRLVYKGADENVPWPWLDIAGLSGFQIRALELEQKIPTTRFAGLVKHAISDTVDPAMNPQLKLRIGGLELPDSDSTAAGSAPDPRGAPQRPIVLNLGRLNAGVRLRDAVHAGGAYGSIKKLTVDVSASLITNGPGGGETIASIEEALCACGKLQSVKVRCREEHAEKLKTALSSWMGLVQAEGQAMPNDEREIVASRKLH